MPALVGPDPLHASARTAEFVQTIQSDLPCPALVAKIFLFSSDPNHRHISGRPASFRGAFRDRHGRGRWDAVDAEGAFDERRSRGRRSRVVLTPRRWRQVLR
jgi:hypothetical protein